MATKASRDSEGLFSLVAVKAHLSRADEGKSHEKGTTDTLNIQRLIVINRSHMTGSKEMGDLIQQFLDNPYKKIVSDNKDIIAY